MLQIGAVTPDALNINICAIQEQHYQISCSDKKFFIPSSLFQGFGSQTCFRAAASGVLIHKGVSGSNKSLLSREAVAEALLCDGFLIPKMDCLKMLNIKYEGEYFMHHPSRKCIASVMTKSVFFFLIILKSVIGCIFFVYVGP